MSTVLQKLDENADKVLTVASRPAKDCIDVARQIDQIETALSQLFAFGNEAAKDEELDVDGVFGIWNILVSVADVCIAHANFLSTKTKCPVSLESLQSLRGLCDAKREFYIC